MQLHIGGKQPDPDWKILDIRPDDHVDFVGDAADLSQFEDESIQRIYASHVLEHFSYQKEITTVLKEWHRVLKPGGTLMVSVPHLPTLCQLYLRQDIQEEERFQLMRIMFGGQLHAYDYHKVGFSWGMLSWYLNKAGFEFYYRVERFGLFDDTSNLTFAGELISLNVEALK